MGTLTITKGYGAGTALMEADIDAFRTGLHTLFNTDKFSSANFAALTITAAKFTGAQILLTDNTNITFGASSDATFGLDSSKQIVFNTVATTTEMQFYAGATYYIEFYTDKLYVPGDIIVGEGGSGRSVLQALSSYKKPVLEWAGTESIKIQANSSTTNETVIFFPNFVAAVTEVANGSAKYRQAAVYEAANGYGAADTGNARGGRRSGVSVTTNSWYACYACKVRSGNNYSATTANFILVFDTTLPTVANETTLNGYYGEGNYVYLGLVRYGFGAIGVSSSIPKFVYSNKGWCYFYEKSTGYGGVDLAYSTVDADDTGTPFYTLASGTSGQVIPETVGHVSLQITRERVSDWYIKDASGDIIWRGGWQDEAATLPHGFVVELPFVTTYTFHQERKSNSAVAKAVTLQGFSDGYMLLRRQGHGI